MKKWISLILMVVLSITLVGCGAKTLEVGTATSSSDFEIIFLSNERI